jgi:hypothetical protein
VPVGDSVTEITDFIRERLAEDRLARRVSEDYYNSMLEIIKIHDEIWPVLTQEPAELQKVETVADFHTVAYQMRQNIEWHTRDSYIKRFGAEPPTNPIVLSFARIWKSHDSFQIIWS